MSNRLSSSRNLPKKTRSSRMVIRSDPSVSVPKTCSPFCKFTNRFQRRKIQLAHVNIGQPSLCDDVAPRLVATLERPASNVHLSATLQQLAGRFLPDARVGARYEDHLSIAPCALPKLTTLDDEPVRTVVRLRGFRKSHRSTENNRRVMLTGQACTSARPPLRLSLYLAACCLCDTSLHAKLSATPYHCRLMMGLIVVQRMARTTRVCGQPKPSGARCTCARFSNGFFFYFAPPPP